jgi:phosphoglucomutase
MLTDEIRHRAEAWLGEDFNPSTREEVRNLIDKGKEDEVVDAFYRSLEFGTGGMRGIMGVGTNRVNKYTLGMATQGLSNYILTTFPNEQCKVAIAYDCRHNSDLFAHIVADVFSANGIKVFLYESLRPTPQLSFTIRELGCHSGIVLTASHNPPEYNGYKVYWNDGAQIVEPHDKNIIAEVEKVTKPSQVKFQGNPDLIELIGAEMDEKFQDACVAQSLRKEGKAELKIVFTSIHGTSIMAAPQALHKAGFTKVYVVEEQATPDGNFPTVKSPNPEEPEALDMALKLAEKMGADIVIGTDPDADRLGVAIREAEGKLLLLNGNQTAALLTWYLLESNRELGRLTGNEFMASTIVTSDLILDICKAYHTDVEVTLTGFKWIAAAIRKWEGKKKFIGGGEESYGYMIGDFVRDKDCVSATLIACEMTAWLKSRGSSVFEALMGIYQRHGLYRERLISITKRGASGAADIQEMMAHLRSNPPQTLGGIAVAYLDDVNKNTRTHLADGDQSPLGLPKSNVLQFHLADGSKISARPSGTEPKIKFYASVKSPWNGSLSYEEQVTLAEKKIEGILKDLNV